VVHLFTRQPIPAMRKCSPLNPLAILFALFLCCSRPVAAQTCPTEDPAIDAAKSNKLFLYFPTVADSSYPAYDTNVSPVQPFDVASLSPGIGTTTQLINSIFAIVVDDYCEFNVQVTSTTSNPNSGSGVPARRSTVAVGADNNGNAADGYTWGETQFVNTGATTAVDYARVWAGTYVNCEGGVGPTVLTGGCSMTGSLTGTNATLTHWAQAIGGTAAHEGGHTFGLIHQDDDPPDDPTGQAGSGPAPGEDAFNKHLMPTGYDLTGPDRADYRRHFSDNDYGILATNVGLSVETMHNWDLVNPNAESGYSLAIDFLSSKSSISIDWFYAGTESPWLNPTVSGPSGTAVFQGTTYNKYRVTWTAGNPAWTNPSAGIVAGGAVFHIGTTFAGVDFNTPNPIIIQDVTLYDASSTALILHPRLPSYDAGTLDGTTGDYSLHFNAPPGAPEMRLRSAAILQLPRVATIDSMVGQGMPYSRDKQPIRPWSSSSCAAAALRDGATCRIANLSEAPHVVNILRLGDPGVVDCSRGTATAAGNRANGPQDSTRVPDYEGPMCAGQQFDPFPSTTVYVIATFVDPDAKHYDPAKKTYVTGPVISKVFYQFAGTRKVAGRGQGTGGNSGSGASAGSCGLCICAALLILGVSFLLLLFLYLRKRKT
jgi:hypothetical protein